MREHAISSGGLELLTREHGDPSASHVVLIHGYPDDQTLWDRVVTGLDGLHVVTYDVRGAGGSQAPPDIRGYAVDRLRDDFVAVLDALVPAGEAVHVVGHDWGSIQAWEFAGAGADDRLAGRVASLVSMSGPPLHHVSTLIRQPEGRLLRLAQQLLRTSYVAAFQVPAVPELVLGRRTPFVAGLLRAMAAQGGVASWSPELARTASNGVNLYRANLAPARVRPHAGHVDVPVLLVELARDALVTHVLLEGLEARCRSLRRVRLDAPHWAPRTHPAEVARLVREHVATVDRSG